MRKCFGSVQDAEFPRFFWPQNTLFSDTCQGKCCPRTDLERGEDSSGCALEPLKGCGGALKGENPARKQHQSRLRAGLSRSEPGTANVP